MMNTLFQIGLEAGALQAERAIERLRKKRATTALSAYPTLLGALEQAERNGSLAAERRRLSGTLVRHTTMRELAGSRLRTHIR